MLKSCAKLLPEVNQNIFQMMSGWNREISSFMDSFEDKNFIKNSMYLCRKLYNQILSISTRAEIQAY